MFVAATTATAAPLARRPSSSSTNCAASVRENAADSGQVQRDTKPNETRQKTRPQITTTTHTRDRQEDNLPVAPDAERPANSA